MIVAGIEVGMYTHPQQGMGHKAVELRREAGAWLRQLRQDRNLSQRDLAKLVNVEYYTFISQIEAGKGRIPPDRYAVWAEALGVEVREFVKTLLKYYDPITYDHLFSEHTSANGNDHADGEVAQGPVVRLV
jgi:transcriptional regulator with XRE-family HTH domain